MSLAETILNPLRAVQHWVFMRLPDTPRVNRAISQYLYFLDNGRFADLAAPKGFAEHCMRFKLSQRAQDPLLRYTADKQQVKEYVAEKLGPGHTIETLQVLRTKEDLAAFTFPLPSVAKPTHSSGDVLIFHDQQPSEVERRLMASWFDKDFYRISREPCYRGLVPKIIVEPFIGDGRMTPDDIKVKCFHGVPRTILVDYDRFGDHSRDFFDMDGRPIDLDYRYKRAEQPFPYAEQLGEIKQAVAALAHDTDFMRIDFYIHNGTLLVGELTYFPNNCTLELTPKRSNEVIGRLFNDPEMPFPDWMYLDTS